MADDGQPAGQSQPTGSLEWYLEDVRPTGRGLLLPAGRTRDWACYAANGNGPPTDGTSVAKPLGDATSIRATLTPRVAGPVLPLKSVRSYRMGRPTGSLAGAGRSWRATTTRAGPPGGPTASTTSSGAASESSRFPPISCWVQGPHHLAWGQGTTAAGRFPTSPRSSSGYCRAEIDLGSLGVAFRPSGSTPSAAIHLPSGQGSASPLPADRRR